MYPKLSFDDCNLPYQHRTSKFGLHGQLTFATRRTLLPLSKPFLFLSENYIPSFIIYFIHTIFRKTAHGSPPVRAKGQLKLRHFNGHLFIPQMLFHPLCYSVQFLWKLNVAAARLILCCFPAILGFNGHGITYVQFNWCYSNLGPVEYKNKCCKSDLLLNRLMKAAQDNGEWT